MEFITLEDYILEVAPLDVTEKTIVDINKGIADKAVKAALKAGRALQTKGGQKGFFFTRGGQKIFAAVKGKVKDVASKIAGKVKEPFKGSKARFKEAQAASKKARGAKREGIAAAAAAKTKGARDRAKEFGFTDEDIDALQSKFGRRIRAAKRRREGAKIAVAGGGAVAAFSAVAIRRAKRRKEKAAAGGRALRPLSAAARKKRRLRPGQTDVSR